MSKKYKNKTCVYCVKPNSSEDGDHIIARGFFLPENRMNLPIVPACKKCNNEKSELEIYLTSVMPFGGTHTEASKTLRELVKPRLAKNDKLRKKLVAEIASVPTFQGQPTRELRISTDTNKLLKLSEFIARGLTYHHWQIYLPSDRFFMDAGFFVGHDMEKRFEGNFSPNARDCVQADLGGGVFVYKGMQAEDCREATVWRMWFYGVELKPSRDSTKRYKALYVITGPIDWLPNLLGA